MATTFKRGGFAAAFSLALLPGLASASVIGFLGNFDVINDTGSTAHGFEIELEGLTPDDISDTFGGTGRWFPSGRGFDPSTSVERYGAPAITSYTNGAISGTKVTYYGIWDSANSAWDFGTPSINPADPNSFVTPGDNCWSGGGVGYGAATPCDHFGVGTLKNPTKTTYSWLHDDGTNSGTLTGVNGKVVLPAPIWDVQPAAPVDPGLPAAPPVVGVQIQAPEAEFEVIDGEPQFGEAIWVKVFTTELEDDVELEDLIGGNPVIDAAKAKLPEIEWQLLQTDPDNPDAGKLEAGYGAPVGEHAASIIRRYEFYKYTGAFNPENNEAEVLFSDSHPNLDPDLGTIEVGAYLGAQNAAANLVGGAPVPVPSAFILMGSGLLGLVATRRTRSNKG